MELMIATLQSVTWRQWFVCAVLCIPAVVMWIRLSREIDQVEQSMKETAKLCRESRDLFKQMAEDSKRDRKETLRLIDDIRKEVREPW